MTESPQLQTWLVCQVCGRHTPVSAARGDWINAEMREHPGLRIVRCPMHWSDHALRTSVMGRTAANRAKMRELAARAPLPEQSPYAPGPLPERTPRRYPA